MLWFHTGDFFLFQQDGYSGHFSFPFFNFRLWYDEFRHIMDKQIIEEEKIEPDFNLRGNLRFFLFYTIYFILSYWPLAIYLCVYVWLGPPVSFSIFTRIQTKLLFRHFHNKLREAANIFSFLMAVPLRHYLPPHPPLELNGSRNFSTN